VLEGPACQHRVEEDRHAGRQAVRQACGGVGVQGGCRGGAVGVQWECRVLQGVAGESSWGVQGERSGSAVRVQLGCRVLQGSAGGVQGECT